jgi:hypothetical protein
MKGAIVKHFVARRTTIVHGCHVHLPHVPLHTSSQSDRLSTDHADEAVLALLHLSLQQQLQLLVGGVGKSYKKTRLIQWFLIAIILHTY